MTSRKITVVFGVNDFLAGGMQRQLIEQLKYFDPQRFNIVLITLLEFPGKPSFFDEIPPGLEVHRLSFAGLGDFRSWRALARLLAMVKPDIVVSSLFFSNTVFRVLKPLLGYVLISREHNTYIDKPKWQQIIDRILAPVSYRIIAVSNTVMEFTIKQERISRQKFVVIHNGIDTQRNSELLELLPSRNTLREELGVESRSLVFLNTSRLIPQKDYALLINGFSKFKEDYPQSQLVIVGGGELEGALKEQVEQLNISDAVLFFGHQSNVLKFYKASDYFISTSRIEGLSNSMLEAQVAGLPLIVTRTAGTDELVEEGKNGLFIEERTPNIVASRMREATRHEFRQEEIRAIIERFDIRGTVAQYSTLFEESLSSR